VGDGRVCGGGCPCRYRWVGQVVTAHLAPWLIFVLIASLVVAVSYEVGQIVGELLVGAL
jgi:hypothetical protein